MGIRNVVLVAALALCVALLFVPHHEKGASSFGNTMYELFARSFTIILEGPGVPSAIVLACVSGLLFAAFYPVVFVTLLRAPHANGVYLIFGVAAMLGAAAEYFAMALSQASIGFSGAGSVRPATAFFGIIPAIHGSIAIASLAVGVSGKYFDRC